MAKIKMGDDEFILYIRKNFPQNKTPNNVLGREISSWFKVRGILVDNKNRDQNCLWETEDGNGDDYPSIDKIKLPKTATQFEFDSALLPALFAHLDHLGKICNTTE